MPVSQAAHLLNLARWNALTQCPSAGAARFDSYDTDSTGTLDKPQVAAVLKVWRLDQVCHYGTSIHHLYTAFTCTCLLWRCTPLHRI